MRTTPTLLLSAWISICAGACASTTPVVPPSIGAGAMPPAPDGALLVTPATSLGRPLEVVALVDLHSAAGTPEQGFAELRRWAATLGGDAVVSAHFEPPTGDDPGHVSGVVVRSKVIDPRTYDVIAVLDVATAEDGADKGLEALRARARELGADKLVDIRFEHSEGGVSHLRGRAVRYR